MATCSYLHLKVLYSNVLSTTSSNSFTRHKLTIVCSSKSSSSLLETPINTLKVIKVPRSEIVTLDPRILGSLIASLIKDGKWKSVPQDFIVFPSKSLFVRLIAGCVSARKFRIVESLLNIVIVEGKDIAVSVFASAMRGYNKLHMYSSTVAAYDTMMSAGLVLDESCYVSVMDAYRKLGNVDNVVSVFTELKKRYIPTAQAYFVLCDALARSLRAFDALRYFRTALEKGFTPTASVYASIIGAFAGIKEAEIAEDLFREAREKGMANDPAMFLKLVVMYVGLGAVEKTVAVVESMESSRIKVTDCVLSAVINAYASKRSPRAAVAAYERLTQSPNCVPGQVTYASIINIYCRLGLPSKAEHLFDEMLQKGFNRCVVAYSNMISMYGKLGRARDATRLLTLMKINRCEPTVWVYNSLMDMYARAGDVRRVEKLWKEMERRAINPDLISYTSIIAAYNKGREYNKCYEVYAEFKANDGRVDMVMAGIMVGVFSKSGRVDEVVRLLRELKEEGLVLDARLFKSAMNALRDGGMRDHVKWLQENFEVV